MNPPKAVEDLQSPALSRGKEKHLAFSMDAIRLANALTEPTYCPKVGYCGVSWPFRAIKDDRETVQMSPVFENPVHLDVNGLSDKCPKNLIRGLTPSTETVGIGTLCRERNCKWGRSV
jgi:hypothetical protein